MWVRSFCSVCECKDDIIHLELHQAGKNFIKLERLPAALCDQDSSRCLAGGSALASHDKCHSKNSE